MLGSYYVDKKAICNLLKAVSRSSYRRNVNKVYFYRNVLFHTKNDWCIARGGDFCGVSVYTVYSTVNCFFVVTF